MSVPESLGLYRQRLHPEGTRTGSEDWWEVHGADSVRVAVADMNVQLDRSGWPVLDSMFARDAMLARVRDGDLGYMKRAEFGVFFAFAEALLLMDDGPSDALDAQLRYALDNVMPRERADAERFDSWVRAQAASA